MASVQAPVTTSVALVQALRDGPGYGRELIRRVARITDGALRLTHARVYPALEALARGRLVSARSVAPGGARGARSRTYYELTAQGLALSTQQRRVLAALVRRGEPEQPDVAERARMRQRLLEADEVSALASELERAMRRVH